MRLSREEFDACAGSGAGLQSQADPCDCAADAFDRHFTSGDGEGLACNLVLTELVEFPGRFLDQPFSVYAQFPGERIGSGPAFGLSGIVAVPHFFPGDHDIAPVGHVQALGRIEVEAVVEFADLGEVEAAGLKVQFAQKVEPGVDVLVKVVHLGQVLGTGEDDLLAVEHQIVRAFIDAVEVVEVLFELRLPVEQMSHIFPFHQVAAPAQNEVSETGVHRLYAKDIVQGRRLAFVADSGMVHLVHLGVSERGRGSVLVPFFGALIEFFLARIQIDYARAGDEVVPIVLLEETGIPEIQRGNFFAEHVCGQNGIGFIFGKSNSAIF